MASVFRLWLLYVAVLAVVGPPTAALLYPDGWDHLTNVEVPAPVPASRGNAADFGLPRPGQDQFPSPLPDSFPEQADSNGASPQTPYAIARGAYNYLVRHNPPYYVWVAYASVVYASAMLLLLYVLFLRQDVRRYDDLAVLRSSQANYRKLWVACIAGILACGFALLIRYDFEHPFVNAYLLDWRQINAVRVVVAREGRPVVYALGVNVFGAGALILALGFIRRWWIVLPTLVAILWLATFQLSKSSLAYLVLEVLVIGMVLRIFPKRAVMWALGLAVASATAAIALSLKSEGLGGALVAMAYRLFLGEFADLPAYFRVFHGLHIGFESLLPGWLHGPLGVAAHSAGRIVILSTVKAHDLGLAGVANTFFTGEAYAFMGFAGVLLAPLLVFLNVWVLLQVFLRLPKNLLSGCVLGYALFKLMVGLFSGISVFIFSGIHVVVITYIVCVLAIKHGIPIVSSRLAWPAYGRK